MRGALQTLAVAEAKNSRINRKLWPSDTLKREGVTAWAAKEVFLFKFLAVDRNRTSKFRTTTSGDDDFATAHWDHCPLDPRPFSIKAYLDLSKIFHEKNLPATMAPILLTGPENLQAWVNDLTRRARRGGCYQMLFPSSSSFTSLGRSNRHQHGNAHLRCVADRHERDAACKLLRDSIPGHIWAYMLTLVVTPEDLFADPALAVKLARAAATRTREAPVTDREGSRLRYVYEVAKPRDYPTGAHFEQGQRWLAETTKISGCT